MVQKSRQFRRTCAVGLAVAGGVAIIGLGMAQAAAQTGKASYYGIRGRTASGTMHSPYGMTAAHRSLPFGTKVRVTISGMAAQPS